MSQGRIITGDELKADVTVSCDVCVVGSGSGGAWTALELVKQGKRVVMLEEGGYHTRREFDMTEPRAFQTLYQELGNRATDDLALTILQGRSVGGGTTVNWCSTFRTPDRILALWRDRHGVDTLSPEVLTPHWEAIERRLHVAPWPQELINENNKVLWDGLGALGYERGLIRRNVNNCLNLGACGMGCPVDAKQSMLVTVLPDAVEQGLTLYSDCSARVLDWDGRRVRAVHAEVVDGLTRKPTGVKVTVKPKVTVVSGGAINSPALLMRSELLSEGRVGERTWVHPVLMMMAEFEHEVNAFRGAPQSVYSHHFIERGPGKMGYFLEVPPVHPMLASIVATGSGDETIELMTKLKHLNVMIAIHVDGLLPEETGGTVRLRRGGYGRHSINYAFTDAHWEAFRHSCKEMAKLQFAAGAKRVRSLHLAPVTLRSPSEVDALDAAPWAPVQVKVATAHQMGGCRMGKDPSTSVVDPRLRYHGLDNLFVVDGSVLPTSLGVNPQETIFGIARWAAGHIGQAV
ncbi:MAG: GMC family oxidoreductase [Myxococcaceae bacterium]|nr:GMC family oxidoreductase [Myxococcaceae bacterium]MCA3016817.1 GMC family oxidoreductase [Myxococcaceae bacterium]